MPAKKKKTIKVAKFRSYTSKPEKVFKVVAKKQPIIKKKPQKKRRKLSIHTEVSKKTIILTVGVVFMCTAILLGYSGKQMLDTLHEAERPAGSLELSAEAVASLKLLGSKSQYRNEIINYQSAPADLQDFVLRDYTLHKANCIVNGQFVGTVRYEIVNVVYDSFARLSKECNGADTVIVAKISGIWTVVLAGNDLPKCSDINAFDIPRGVAPQCRTGYVTYTNPNP